MIHCILDDQYWRNRFYSPLGEGFESQSKKQRHARVDSPFVLKLV